MGSKCYSQVGIFDMREKHVRAQRKHRLEGMKNPAAALPLGQAVRRGPPRAAAGARPSAGAVPERAKATTFRS